MQTRCDHEHMRSLSLARLGLRYARNSRTARSSLARARRLFGWSWQTNQPSVGSSSGSRPCRSNLSIYARWSRRLAVLDPGSNAVHFGVCEVSLRKRRRHWRVRQGRQSIPSRPSTAGFVETDYFADRAIAVETLSAVQPRRPPRTRSSGSSPTKQSARRPRHLSHFSRHSVARSISSPESPWGECDHDDPNRAPVGCR
jgi:hypothetical protein